MSAFRIASFCLIVTTITTANSSAAEIDTVYRKSDGKAVGGEITSITRTEIVIVDALKKETSVPANDVASIEFKAEPPTLSLARSNEKSGNFAEALTGYQEALGDAPSGKLKSEINFLIARTLARTALADATQAAAATDKLKAFLSENQENFRFYDAQQYLAEVSQASGDTAAAREAFALLEQAPWEEVKMAGRLGTARGLLAAGSIAEAKTIFDGVAAFNPTNALEQTRRFDGILGQAACLQSQGKLEEAVTSLQAVIDGVAAGESRLLAEAYLRQGDCLSARGTSPKDAVLAYLHVDVIPTLAAHADLHAEALYQLSKLWNTVGQPARAADAASRLEQEYPNSEWAKKLQQGS